MTEHETTIRWTDPAEGLAALPGLDGFDFMNKMRTGELPGAPIASHLGMELTGVGHGTVTFQCHPDESHYNPIGMVHGGLVATLLDSALGCATHTHYTPSRHRLHLHRDQSELSAPDQLR